MSGIEGSGVEGRGVEGSKGFSEGRELVRLGSLRRKGPKPLVVEGQSSIPVVKLKFPLRLRYHVLSEDSDGLEGSIDWVPA